MYSVEAFYGTDGNGHGRGFAEGIKTSDWSNVETTAHDMVSHGYYVEITNTETGKQVQLDYDAYFENFNGEFPYKPSDLA